MSASKYFLSIQLTSDQVSSCCCPEPTLQKQQWKTLLFLLPAMRAFRTQAHAHTEQAAGHFQDDQDCIGAGEWSILWPLKVDETCTSSKRKTHREGATVSCAISKPLRVPPSPVSCVHIKCDGQGCTNAATTFQQTPLQLMVPQSRLTCFRTSCKVASLACVWARGLEDCLRSRQVWKASMS